MKDDKIVGRIPCGGCNRDAVIRIAPYGRDGSWTVRLSHRVASADRTATGQVIMNDVVKDPTAYLAAYIIGELRRSLYDLYASSTCYRFWSDAENAAKGLGLE